MIKPLGEYVLLKLVILDETTEGGIVLPSSNNKPFNVGLVIDIGPDCKSAKIGHTVIFPAAAGVRSMHKGKEYLMLLDRELWGEVN